ncbi:hypothetical protein BH11PSE7_BH11PSE7_22110 [soil metagenome]
MDMPNTDKNQALFDACITQAMNGARPLMEKMLSATRSALQDEASRAAAGPGREALRDSLRLLGLYEGPLSSLFPQSLETALSGPDGSARPKSPGAALSFDELELMDDAQVQETVELARAQQAALLATEIPLQNFNALICAVQGLKTVQPGHNPLRPEVYVRALRTSLTQCGAPAAARLRWLGTMGDALGRELADSYVSLSVVLRQAGVVGSSYVVTQVGGASAPAAASGAAPVAGAAAAPAAAAQGSGSGSGTASLDAAATGTGTGTGTGAGAGAGAGAGSAAQGASRDEVLLTVKQLRRLLSGELDGARPRVAGGASAGSGFVTSLRHDTQHTVPAAFEALQEMKQVDQVMQRLRAQTASSPVPQDVAGATPTLAGLRQQLRTDARGVGQQLGLEVVNLMVENIAGDKRLLAPLQQVVRELEPALLRLALIDPRFFSDKLHPARRLLEQMTQRSLAWQDASAPAFIAFMEPLTEAVQVLARIPIENVEPFDYALKTLTQVWSDQQRREKRQRESAVKSLLQAEQRNILAGKLARDIRAREDAQLAPQDITTFLAGPWAQVMAQARLSDRAGMADPGGYGAVINDLIWSAQPELARNSVPRLTRIIPGLLAALREGLASIDYPQEKLTRFFDELMELHQQALRPAGAVVPTPVATRAELDAQFAERMQEEPWLAPAEAKDSGFMDTGMLDSSLEAALDHNGQKPDFAPTQAGFSETRPASAWRTSTAGAPAPDDLIPAGSWVEFVVGNRATRTQLTWASPHGTLFMFTNAEGSTHSMTRRSLDKLLADGGLRVISDHAVVDEALDAVAQAAMRNSLDIAL